MIVADTNLIAYLHLPGEHTSIAEQVLLRDPEWHAPPLWRSEFRNLLTLYVRKGVLTVDASLKVFDSARRTIGGRESSAETGRILELSSGSSCSAYDCEFIALAEALGVHLVTFDAKVLKGFPNVALAAEGFVSGQSESADAHPA